MLAQVERLYVDFYPRKVGKGDGIKKLAKEIKRGRAGSDRKGYQGLCSALR